jgi:hypothetical protein
VHVSVCPSYTPRTRGHTEPSSVSSLGAWVFFLRSKEGEGHHSTLVEFPNFAMFQIMYKNLSCNVLNYVTKAIM